MATAASSGFTPLEIAVLGRAVGESIVVMIGDDVCLVVDSFMSKRPRRPAALRYLEAEGRTGRDVTHVVATHWDDDHVRGLAEVVAAAAPDVCFYSPMVADQRALAELVAASEEAAAGDDAPTGAAHYGRVLHELAKRGAPGDFAMGRTTVFRRGGVEVLALSPTDWAVRHGWASVARDLENAPTPGAAAATAGANCTSIVLLVTTETHCALLAGDLERHPKYGWSRAIAATKDVRPDRAATLVKIPHHGSEDAHDDEMWSVLLAPEPEAVLTPFSTALPRNSDLERIEARAAQTMLAAGGAWSRWDDVATIIATAVPGARVDLRYEIGCIRYSAVANGEWEVEQRPL